jgi:hypothetical protein
VDYNDCFSVEEELEIGLACTPREIEGKREQFCWLKEIELGCYVELVPSGMDSPGEICEKKKREGKGEESDSKGVFGRWWLGDKNGD